MRFYETGEKPDVTYRFESDDGLDQELNEDNLIGNFHEIMQPDFTIVESQDSLYDRVCVLDPRDGMHWQFWRFDRDPEDFAKLEYMVRRVGTYLVRQTVMSNIRDAFEAAHKLTDEDFEQLLGAGDE
jgi:hypothetical protein